MQLDPKALANPDVVGISTGGDWPTIEKTQGQYDWSSVDARVKQIKDAHKFVLLRFITGGRQGKPDWLYNLGSPTFSWKDPKDGSVLTIPVFWDQKYVDAHVGLIKAAGAHFSNDPSVKVVADNFGNAQTNDWAVPTSGAVDGLPPASSSQVSRWMSAGWTHDKMVSAGKQTIDALMNAFPNASVYVALGPVKSTVMEPAGEFALVGEVAEYARTKYGDRLIVGKNSCNGVTCISDFQKAHPPFGAQALVSCFNDPSRMMPDGNPDNLTPDQILRRTFDNAKGSRVYEVYQSDVVNLPDAVAYGSSVIGQ